METEWIFTANSVFFGGYYDASMSQFAKFEPLSVYY